MIETENLNNQSLEDILDEAKKQILYFTSKWTNFQESDPGITLIELFSWLKHTQHEYLNRDFEGVRRKFLSLLDVNLQKSRGSETLIKISDNTDDVNIPLKTKFKSGNMIFENIYHQTAIKSKILSVHFENSDNDSEEEYYKFDGNRKFYLFGQNIDDNSENFSEKKYFENSILKSKKINRFTINFDSPLPKNTEIGLYFSIYNNQEGPKRNSIKKNDEFEKMAIVNWEYYTQNGWEKIEILSDDTHDFLFSGIIRIKLKNNAAHVNGQYKIRASLICSEYDYPPRITNILSNVFKALQNNTLCENTIIKKSDIKKDGSFELYSHTAIYGENELFISKLGGWKKINTYKEKKDINSGKVKITVLNALDHAKTIGTQDDLFMVISYDKSMKNRIILGSGKGISPQFIHINDENVLENSLKIMVSEKIKDEEIFYKWESVSDFFSSNKYDKHFVYDKARKCILFGDHINAVAPRKIKDGIRLCKIQYSFAGDSNTKEGMINSVITENNVLKKSRIEQISRAHSGMNAETFEQAQARAANIFLDPKRIVTKSDYEEIVHKTPGLLFTNVKIIPNYMKDENTETQNCVTIAVRWNKKIGVKLPKSYERNIMNHIEKYRLLNTKIKIVAPEYIGLLIIADIVVDSSYKEKDNLIEKEIYQFIENLNKNLGQILRFGDLFGTIDKIKCVSMLEKLKILPTGKYTEKNVSEDVVIPPNGVYYIKKINLNFTRSSQI